MDEQTFYNLRDTAEDIDNVLSDTIDIMKSKKYNSFIALKEGQNRDYFGTIGLWRGPQSDYDDMVESGVIDEDTIYMTWETQTSHIYGVSWPLSGTTLTRTDDSASFSSTPPDPYVNDGYHPGSSPFDDLYPWSGMVRETINGNEMVKIPKFWYKIEKTNSALNIQIADGPVEGFSISPAHRARGSEQEHDYVWIGRYHCDDNYKSTSGVKPKSNITRATARSGVHDLGDSYWQLDYSLLVTIWLLYLVEFANWDSQEMIGYDCGSGSSVGLENSGSTDTMPYHTGTMQASRRTYGVGVQYRYIEDLWGNICDWCDGITFNQANIYCFENPSNYSDDSTGATLVGERPLSSSMSDYISNWGVSSEEGFEWFLYPSNVSSNSSEICTPDMCMNDSRGTVLLIGGHYNKYPQYGLFALSGYGEASTSTSSVGARLQYRPNS